MEGCSLPPVPVDPQILGPFLLAVLVIQLTPGPGMLFILANGIAGGRRAGVAAAFGAASGMVVHTIAAAAGLAAVFRAAPPVYDGVRLAGAAYLLWLAVGHLRSSGRLSEMDSSPESGSVRSVFRRAMVNNLANPKVILFFVAFLPQFIVHGGSPAFLQFIFLGAVFLSVGLALDVTIGSLSGGIGDTLRRNARLRTILDRLAGTIFGMLGLRLLLDSRRP
jgi:threonine/homoserine/homoserine lactone efflux protein